MLHTLLRQRVSQFKYMTMTSADDRPGSQNATSHTQCHSLTQLVMLFVLVFINKAVRHYEHDRGQTFERTAPKSAQCVRPSSPWNYPIIIHRRMCSQHVWIMRYIKTLCEFWSDCKYTQHRCVCSVWPVKTNALFLARVFACYGYVAVDPAVQQFERHVSRLKY